MTRRLWQLVLWTGLGAAMLVAAHLLINTTFMLYDDEGYVLLTYRKFLAGGRLYDDIFTQYGPWPYVYHLLVSLGWSGPMTHAVGRALTAAHWTLCALLIGAITARVTGRMVAAVFASLLSFGLLWQMSSEPSHPGSLICATLAVAAFGVTVTHPTARWTWLGAIVGVAAALLVLTKINVGLLFIAGAGAGALRLTTWPGRWRRPADFIAAIGLLAVPWGLMAKKLDEPWVLVFAVQFTMAAAGLLWVTPATFFARRVPPRTWLVALGGFAGTVAVIAATVVLRGTSGAALVQAVLIDPLRHPASFMIGFSWTPATWPVAAVCWAVAAWAGWDLRRAGELSGGARWAVIAVRLAAAAVLMINAETWLTHLGVGRFIVSCLPLLPVFLVPLGPRPAGENERAAGAVLWAASLALPQVLHAYPVAGSQMGWGTFLLLPTMVAGMQAALEALARALPSTGRWVPRTGWSLLLAVGAAQLALLLYTGCDRYRTSRPLGLPGAENIRAGDIARQTLRTLTLNASVHADVLFSRPGMFSYNLWSGVPTPTDRNATHWFWLLDEPAQAAIIARLEAVPRSAIVVSEGLDDFLASIHVPMKGPLQSYVQAHYQPLFTLGDFHFLVPLHSRAVPFGLVDILVPTGETAAKESRTLLQTNVVLDGQPDSVRTRGVQTPWAVGETYTAGNARLVLEPITTQGDLAGPAIELPCAHPVRGLFRLSVFAGTKPRHVRPRDLELTVLDPTGAVLSESAF